MISFGFNKFGGPDVFETLKRPQPIPKPTQYLIKTTAVGVNPYEAAVRQGLTQADRPLSFPVVPGSDVVGTVVAAGKEATEFKIGEQIIGRASIAGYSELVAVGRKAAVRLPVDLPVEQAAALPTPGITAYDILSQTNALSHEKIAIIGASGVVGSILTQLAAPLFKQVIAVARDANTVPMGPNISAYDYQELLSEPTPQPLIINTVNGGRHADLVANLMTETSTMIGLNGIPEELANSFPTATLIDFNDAAFKQKRAALDALIDAYEGGQLKIPIAATFPFTRDGVVSSHELLATHHQPGKIVLKAD